MPKFNQIPSRGPSPNRGSSLPDVQAIGPDHTTKAKWRQSRGIDPSTQVRIVKVSHMRYQHPDLSEITQFLRGEFLGYPSQRWLSRVDFGMNVVKKNDTERWYQGYGPDQYVYYAREGPKAFLGGTFEVESFEDLEKYVFARSSSRYSDFFLELVEYQELKS